MEIDFRSKEKPSASYYVAWKINDTPKEGLPTCVKWGESQIQTHNQICILVLLRNGILLWQG